MRTRSSVKAHPLGRQNISVTEASVATIVCSLGGLDGLYGKPEQSNVFIG